MKNKRILVTGGAGSIGSELVRQLAPKNKIFILDNNETETYCLSEELKQKGYWVKPRVGDIRDMETVSDLFEDFKPQVIFHAGAYKHVPPNEIYPLEAIKTNIIGTYNVLHQAKRYECLEQFVYISTDKVVNAQSVMGATKKVGEIMVKNAGGIVVRFGNVMGSRGSAVPIWQRQLDEGKPLTITDERMERYMMTIPQACELVIKAAEEGEGGSIYIMDMGKPVNILETLKQVLAKAGIPDHPIQTIGIRPGETLDEKLMTAEEEQRATKKGNFYIIK